MPQGMKNEILTTNGVFTSSPMELSASFVFSNFPKKILTSDIYVANPFTDTHQLAQCQFNGRMQNAFEAAYDLGW